MQVTATSESANLDQSVAVPTVDYPPRWAPPVRLVGSQEVQTRRLIVWILVEEAEARCLIGGELGRGGPGPDASYYLPQSLARS